MTRVLIKLLIFLGLATACLAQAPASTSGNPANIPLQGESSSKARPDLPPAPSDSPMPPPDASEQSGKTSGVKGVLNRVAPHCLYVIYSTCWNVRSGRNSEAAKPNSEFEKDMEVADFYFKRGNFRAAESRYRDALEQKPNDPEATFRLATSLEKAHEPENARIAYQAYLTLFPDGPHAKAASKALRRFGAH